MIDESWEGLVRLLEEASLSLELGIEITGKKPVEKEDVQGHRGKAVWEQRDQGTGARFGTKGQLELVITDPALDRGDTSPRKSYVLGGSTELGRSGPHSGSSYTYPRPGSVSPCPHL